jgi:hypothetical protein
MRVLSPRMEPPDSDDDGSMASTASFLPCSISQTPSASMKVDLPAPGTPEMPTRIARPVLRQQGIQHLLGALLVIPARRLDQRDRLGQRAALAGQHAVDQRLVGGVIGFANDIGSLAQVHSEDQPRALRISSRTLRAESSIRVPGPKIALAPAA